MPTVITIGCHHYAISKAADAAAIIKAMAGAVVLERGRFQSKEVYWPSDATYASEVSMRTVPATAFFPSDPKDMPPDQVARQHPDRAPRRLLGPSTPEAK